MERSSFTSVADLNSALAAGRLPPGHLTIAPEVYHASNAVSHSMLKHMRDSAAKARLRIKSPPPATPAQDLGTALHMALFERDRFDSTYAVRPKHDRRTKAGKAAAEEWEAKNAGRQPLDEAEFETIYRVSSIVEGDDFLRQFVVPGVKEKSWFTRDAETGMWLRCRTDNWIEELNVIVDLKTTQCAHPREFYYDITKYHYWTQASFYCDVVEAVTGTRPDGYVVLAVEKTGDCDVAAYVVEDDTLAAGRRVYREWLRRYAECFKSDRWPGYDRRFISYRVPERAVESALGLSWAE